jgi:hypothetical protein
MKISSGDHTFMIPVQSGLHILYESDNKNEFLDCMNSYFVQKKKTKCIIKDDEDELIAPKSAEFIYLSSKEDLSSVFDFKQKTLLNTELEKFIGENPQMYQSVEYIRKDLRELLTDQGMFKFMNILVNGLVIDVNINTTNFSVSKILQSLNVDIEELTKQEQIIMLYNLLIYINRKQFSIIYIDFEIDEETMEWLNRIKSPNRIILVSNDSIEDYYAELFDSIIILSTNEFVETINIDITKASLLSYVLHPIVMKHPEYQNEKIIDIMRLFRDETSTFLVEFITDNELKAFI